MHIPEEKGTMQRSDTHMIWEVLAAGPLTHDAELIVRWARTSFFVGCPVPEPIILENREYILYLRCSEELVAVETYKKAKHYFQEVRLMQHGQEVPVEYDPSTAPAPEDDLLGGHAALSTKGGCC